MQFPQEQSLLLIPVHNYMEGVRRLKSFADAELGSLVGNWHAVLIDNCSSPDSARELKAMAGGRWSYVHQGVPKNLKINFERGIEKGREMIDPTSVMIWETDAVPNRETLKAMLSVYSEEKGTGKLASVSPMYKWQGRWCYPTHKHWHTDPLYKKHPSWGEISRVHAVPFLFSVWVPAALGYINRQEFRPLVHLDSDFGQFVTDKGMNHLRLKDYSVDHWGGGRMTRG
jgi:hypothetical protein